MIRFARDYAGLLLISLVLMGCGKPAAETPDKAKAPSPQRPVEATSPVHPEAATAVASTEVEEPQTAQGLASTFFQNKDEAEQIEIIYRIADMQSAESVQTLTSLFRAIDNPDLKGEVLSSLSATDKETPARLALVQEALAPNQNVIVRESASDLLFMIDDPSTTAIWGTLKNDPDETIRKTAESMLELEQPVK